MSARRSLSWSTALSDMRNDRVQVPAGFLGARGRVEGMVRFGKVALVKADGSFNRAGIMTAAASAAKAHQLTYGSTWAVAMSVALKAAWQAARTTRARAAH
ncbi:MULTISPECIES: hypothetical protein [Methylorubrum]|uniref:hypothetical protein n=1 Tax=Methylorubrum TaxID=2282523 RepID=UPI00209C984E|nr:MULTISPECIES: hypothetical protein [Methylorubrum]MCP1547000.1 hypothetical protein [Methylorubrum zatmanii]MCP1551721.1 hypothetical protein [Methylorubrum extorquens]MCP1577303.1 hypothetical protein [Methylorubrum extorquens]